jgi:hypothetical protein
MLWFLFFNSNITINQRLAFQTHLTWENIEFIHHELEFRKQQEVRKIKKKRKKKRRKALSTAVEVVWSNEKEQKVKNINSKQTGRKKLEAAKETKCGVECCRSFLPAWHKTSSLIHTQQGCRLLMIGSCLVRA